VPDSEQCKECSAELVQPAVIHTRRTCEACGRTIYRAPISEGLHVGQGDQVIIPPGALNLSLDPQEASGHFTYVGVSFFLQMLLGNNAAEKPADIRESLQDLYAQSDTFLAQSPFLADLDADSDEASKQAYDRLEKQPQTPEWLAMRTGGLARLAIEAIENGDAVLAAWGAQQAMIAHAAFVFDRNLKDLVWNGYVNFGVDQISEALALWEEHKESKAEDLWHTALRDQPFLLSQLLSAPVVIENDKVYVGGKGVKDTGGSIADFLLRNAVLDNVALLEIKTPATKLLRASAYRGGAYAPSPELAGGIVQLATYRDNLLKDHYSLSHGREYEAFDPRCVLLIGNGEKQLTGSQQRRSFDLFRAGLRNVDVVTYDELFARARALRDLLRSP
jgi:hypothetical protein